MSTTTEPEWVQPSTRSAPRAPRHGTTRRTRRCPRGPRTRWPRRGRAPPRDTSRRGQGVDEATELFVDVVAAVDQMATCRLRAGGRRTDGRDRADDKDVRLELGTQDAEALDRGGAHGDDDGGRFVREAARAEARMSRCTSSGVRGRRACCLVERDRTRPRSGRSAWRVSAYPTSPARCRRRQFASLTSRWPLSVGAARSARPCQFIDGSSGKLAMYGVLSRCVGPEHSSRHPRDRA